MNIGYIIEVLNRMSAEEMIDEYFRQRDVPVKKAYRADRITINYEVIMADEMYDDFIRNFYEEWWFVDARES